MEGKFNIFAVLGKRMEWLSQRQRVLADNIANADKPNYVPRDLNEGEYQRVLRDRQQPVDRRRPTLRTCWARRCAAAPLAPSARTIPTRLRRRGTRSFSRNS